MTEFKEYFNNQLLVILGGLMTKYFYRPGGGANQPFLRYNLGRDKPLTEVLHGRFDLLPGPLGR
jgi:hypothetical protein